MSEAVDLATVVSLLDDECARAVLVATSTAAMSATELDDDLDASLSTVYRRLERLDDAGRVVEETRPRADGHHDTVYSADLDEFTVSLAEDGLDCEIQRRREDVAGRLARRWDNLKGWMTYVYGFTLVELAVVATAGASTLVGLYIGYLSSRENPAVYGVDETRSVSFAHQNALGSGDGSESDNPSTPLVQQQDGYSSNIGSVV